MKSTAWRLKHIADGDAALEAAAKLLDRQSDDALRRTEALIALARAHYRAVEAEANARATR